MGTTSIAVAREELEREDSRRAPLRARDPPPTSSTSSGCLTPWATRRQAQLIFCIPIRKIAIPRKPEFVNWQNATRRRERNTARATGKVETESEWMARIGAVGAIDEIAHQDRENYNIEGLGSLF